MIFEQNMDAKLKAGEAGMRKLWAIAAKAKTDALARKSFYELTDAVRAGAEAQLGAWESALSEAQAMGKTDQVAAEQQLEALRAGMEASMNGMEFELNKLKTNCDNASKNSLDEQTRQLEIWYEIAQNQVRSWAEDLKDVNIKANMSAGISDSAMPRQLHHELESLCTDMADEFQAWKHDLNKFKERSETASKKLGQEFGEEFDQLNVQLELIQKNMAALQPAGSERHPFEGDVKTAMTQFEQALGHAISRMNDRTVDAKQARALPQQLAESQVASDANLIADAFVEDLMANDKTHLKSVRKDAILAQRPEGKANK